MLLLVGVIVNGPLQGNIFVTLSMISPGFPYSNQNICSFGHPSTNIFNFMFLICRLVPVIDIADIPPTWFSTTINDVVYNILHKATLLVKGEFAVVPTDNILWAELIIKNPCWYEQHIYETVTWPTWPKGHITQNFEF